MPSIRNSGSVILPCTCRHPNQDAIYGEGFRLHNRCCDDMKRPMRGARCTVCGDVKQYRTKAEIKAEEKHKKDKDKEKMEATDGS